jgi:chitinase
MDYAVVDELVDEIQRLGFAGLCIDLELLASRAQSSAIVIGRSSNSQIREATALRP